MKYSKPIRKDGLFYCPCGHPKGYKDPSGFRYHYRKEHAGKVEEKSPVKEVVKDIVYDEYGLTDKQLKRILVAKRQTQIKPTTIEFGETYKFGAMGDNHFCSQEERREALNIFYDMCEAEGIKDVYNAGDVVAGQGVYRGQEYEIHTYGADNQVKYVVENYPRRKGITTHFVTGNHDYAYYKQIGLDIGEMIKKERDDMNYLGMFQADVMWKGIPLIRVVHPDGGMTYAISYRMQKYVEQISSSKKPKIILSGHQHTACYFFYRNIYVVQVGAFEGQTKLILRKGINPTIGGWIITVRFCKDSRRSIKSFIADHRIIEY